MDESDGWMMSVTDDERDRQTDGRTDGRTPDARTRYIWRLYTIGPYGAMIRQNIFKKQK